MHFLDEDPITQRLGGINLALVAGNTSWALLGARAAAELGEEFVGLLELFGIDAAGLLEEFAASQGLPAFDRFARDLLAALFVGVALFIPSGVASGLAAVRIWRLTPAAERLLDFLCQQAADAEPVVRPT